jgi:hypothetical protein
MVPERKDNRAAETRMSRGGRHTAWHARVPFCLAFRPRLILRAFARARFDCRHCPHVREIDSSPRCNGAGATARDLHWFSAHTTHNNRTAWHRPQILAAKISTFAHDRWQLRAAVYAHPHACMYDDMYMYACMYDEVHNYARAYTYAYRHECTHM